MPVKNSFLIEVAIEVCWFLKITNYEFNFILRFEKTMQTKNEHQNSNFLWTGTPLLTLGPFYSSRKNKNEIFRSSQKILQKLKFMSKLQRSIFPPFDISDTIFDWIFWVSFQFCNGRKFNDYFPFSRCNAPHDEIVVKWVLFLILSIQTSKNFRFEDNFF